MKKLCLFLVILSTSVAAQSPFNGAYFQDYGPQYPCEVPLPSPYRDTSLIICMSNAPQDTLFVKYNKQGLLVKEELVENLRGRTKRYFDYDSLNRLTFYATVGRGNDSNYYYHQYDHLGELSSVDRYYWDSVDVLLSRSYKIESSNGRSSYCIGCYRFGNQAPNQILYRSGGKIDSLIINPDYYKKTKIEYRYSGDTTIRTVYERRPRYKWIYDRVWTGSYYQTLFYIVNLGDYYHFMSEDKIVLNEDRNRPLYQSYTYSYFNFDWQRKTYQYDSLGNLRQILGKTKTDSLIYSYGAQNESNFKSYRAYRRAKLYAMLDHGFCFPSSLSQGLETSLSQAQIYPNPFQNNLQVELVAPAELQIINLQGQVFRQQHLDPGQHQLDVADLPSGVYLLQLKEGEEVQVQKMLKL